MDGPRVTISDPSSPRGPGDPLQAREPWRPSRRLVVVVSGLVALVLVVGAGLRIADSRSADERAGRALADVHLGAQLDGVTSSGGMVTATVSVLLPRAGDPTPTRGLTVVGATVGGGWSLSSALTPGASRLATIELSRTVTCPRVTTTAVGSSASVNAVPEPVLGLVLAVGSQRRQVRLAVPPLARDYAKVVLSSCGRDGDVAATQGSRLEVHRIGDHLEADLLLTNDSDHAVPVLGVSSEGLTTRVVDRLPLLLPRRPSGRRSEALRITRLHVVLQLARCTGSGQVLGGAVTEDSGLLLQLGHGSVRFASTRLRELQVALVLERCRRRS